MSVFSHVHALCETIRDRVTIPVLLRRPDSAVPDLHVWPWRMGIDVEWSKDPPRPPMGEGRSLVDQRHAAPIFSSIQCLHLSVEGWTSLENAQLAFHDHPLFTVDGNIGASSQRRASQSEKWLRYSSRRRSRFLSARRLSTRGHCCRWPSTHTAIRTESHAAGGMAPGDGRWISCNFGRRPREWTVPSGDTARWKGLSQDIIPLFLRPCTSRCVPSRYDWPSRLAAWYARRCGIS